MIGALSKRTITGFHRDEEDDWVAELSCGHGQHLRHKPPFEERVAVTTAIGREGLVGESLDCLFCNMPALPDGLSAYKATKTFDAESVPKGLLSDHTTKTGTWARIIVEEGRLLYTIHQESWVLQPGVVGIVEPTVPHRVAPQGAVRFHVEFLKELDAE